MEPRPEGRGEFGAGKMEQRGAVYFNGATSRRTWRAAAPLLGTAIECDTSMEPRPEGRGELNLSAQTSTTNDTSMEPRPEGRGEEF